MSKAYIKKGYLKAGFYIKEELYKEIKKRARENEKTISEIINKAIEIGLK